jgi:hypothetical protein
MDNEKEGSALDLEYNSQRPDLVIPEYGRNIQKMVDYAINTKDSEERNEIVRAIISVMGQLFPYLRDIDDFTHKLWDHLHIISRFQLDVEGPFPKPDVEELNKKPEPIPYPDGEVRYGHYGKTIPALIKQAADMEPGDKQDTLALILANLMKKHYTTWTRKTVEDQLIKDQLHSLSKGVLKIDPSVELVHAAPPSQQPSSNKPKKKKGGGKKGGGKRRN